MTEMTLEQRLAVAREARKFLGVKFQHAGRNEHGLDCIGLLVLATRNAGMEVYDNPDYSPIVNSEYLVDELSHAAVRLPEGTAPRVGDVMLFNVGRHPQHVALITNVGLEDPNDVTMIHSYQTVGRVVEHPLDVNWARRAVSLWSWRPS